MNDNVRIQCRHCGKNMIPRIITGPPSIRGNSWTPIPLYSVCPFCAEEHERFTKKNIVASSTTLFGFLVFLGILYSIFGQSSSPKNPPNTIAKNSQSVSLADQHIGQTPLTTRNPLVNAAPLGLEIGYANSAGLFALYPNAQQSQSNVPNGTAFSVEAATLNMEGLESVLFIFDQNKTLIAARLSMRKDPNGILPSLKGKYRLVSNQVNSHLNYGNARLDKGNSVVELLSEHLSFTMHVNYQTRDYYKDAKQSTQDERSEMRKTRAQQL